MTKTLSKNFTISSRERGILIVLAVLMVAPIPFTWIFFLLPLLTLPVALLAILVALHIIKNPIAVRAIQFLSVIAAIFSLGIAAILLNYLSA